MVLAAGQVAPAMADESPCALNGVPPVPVMETAKAHFLKGEYREFHRVAMPFVPDNAADAEARYVECFQQVAGARRNVAADDHGPA